MQVRFPFEQALQRDLQRRLSISHDVDIKRLWKRMTQLTDPGCCVGQEEGYFPPPPSDIPGDSIPPRVSGPPPEMSGPESLIEPSFPGSFPNTYAGTYRESYWSGGFSYSWPSFSNWSGSNAKSGTSPSGGSPGSAGSGAASGASASGPGTEGSGRISGRSPDASGSPWSGSRGTSGTKMSGSMSGLECSVKPLLDTFQDGAGTSIGTHLMDKGCGWFTGNGTTPATSYTIGPDGYYLWAGTDGAFKRIFTNVTGAPTNYAIWFESPKLAAGGYMRYQVFIRRSLSTGDSVNINFDCRNGRNLGRISIATIVGGISTTIGITNNVDLRADKPEVYDYVGTIYDNGAAISVIVTGNTNATCGANTAMNAGLEGKAIASIGTWLGAGGAATLVEGNIYIQQFEAW